MSEYYLKNLEDLDVKECFEKDLSIRFKFKADNGKETKWLTLNFDSAYVLYTWLKNNLEYFKDNEKT
jgi:hypothetical protein